MTPHRHVMRFERKEKLTSKFISPFEILERISKVAYILAISSSMDRIYNVFHLLLFRKYMGDSSHILRTYKIKLIKDLMYEKQLMKILNNKNAPNKQIPLVKVFWRNQKVKKATWEVKLDMRDHHLKLFGLNFRDKILNKKRRNVTLLGMLQAYLISFPKFVFKFGSNRVKYEN